MKERPILMSAPMVLACLREVSPKTQTRRVVKPQPTVEVVDAGVITSGNPAANGVWSWLDSKDIEWASPVGEDFRCPYGVPGDVLWVRETLRRSEVGPWVYRADGEPVEMPHGDPRAPEMVAWAHHKEGDTCVSIHMPRWACRLRLRITDVRVERLNGITEADARAEGLIRQHHVWRDCEYPLPDVAYLPWAGAPHRFSCPVQAYQALWEHINGEDSWSSNPWIWAVSFERVT
jgi:hypothetical protein